MLSEEGDRCGNRRKERQKCLRNGDSKSSICQRPVHLLIFNTFSLTRRAADSVQPLHRLSRHTQRSSLLFFCRPQKTLKHFFCCKNTQHTINFSRLARRAWMGFPQNRIFPAPSIRNTPKIHLNFLHQMALWEDLKKKVVGTSTEDDTEVWVLQMGQQCQEGKRFQQQCAVIQFVAMLKFCHCGEV